jgi:hypothetical protein
MEGIEDENGRVTVSRTYEKCRTKEKERPHIHTTKPIESDRSRVECQGIEMSQQGIGKGHGYRHTMIISLSTVASDSAPGSDTAPLSRSAKCL